MKDLIGAFLVLICLCIPVIGWFMIPVVMIAFKMPCSYGRLPRRK